MKSLFVLLGHMAAMLIIFIIGGKLGYSSFATGIIFWIGTSYGRYQERTLRQ